MPDTYIICYVELQMSSYTSCIHVGVLPTLGHMPHLYINTYLRTHINLVSWKRLYPMANGVGSPASLDTTNPIKGMMVYCSTAPSITLPGAAKTF